MTDITQRLIQLDGQLVLHNEGEWSNSVSDYSAFNDAGVECEVGEFLYGLTQLLKPKHVLETGTHWGIGASYLGLGLLDNGIGELETIEFLPEIHKVADARINRVGIRDITKNYLMDARQFTPSHNYQLILLDTEPQTRFGELVKFFPYLDEGGFVFIHDLHRHMQQVENLEHGFAFPFGKIPEEIVNWVCLDQLRPFHFGNPRGLTGFYKVSSKDYKW